MMTNDSSHAPATTSKYEGMYVRPAHNDALLYCTVLCYTSLASTGSLASHSKDFHASKGAGYFQRNVIRTSAEQDC